MDTWIIQQPPKYVLPLTKAATFWFLFGQLALTRAYILGTSPVPLLCFATIGFILHTVVVLLGSVVSHGLSLRLCFSSGLFLALGVSTLSTVNTINEAKVPGPDWTIQYAADTFDSLIASVALTPISELQQSVSIPTSENQAGKLSKNVTGGNQPLQIVGLERTQDGLRVTLHNTIRKSIRNIRYQATYFGVSNSKYVEGAKESLITNEILPHSTWTLELPDDPANGIFYGSVTLVGWDVDQAS